MTLKHIEERDDVFARRYEYDDGEILAADLGVGSEASVDVLGEEAIVVVEDGDETRQLELQLPEGEAEAFITNGVLSIEVGQ
ncbi:DUF7127 family protein [Halorussus halobius]|uniref:DUF7127 family protein n=1 Tax=Halorussus halobius TaxID=1710537 RepID=UPI001092A832|nr:hypothetical protein [Halorussus halobius]